MMENKVDWKEAGRMLCDGKNFTEIAEAFGVSRQYISAHYVSRGYRRARTKVNTRYAGVREYLGKNEMSILRLAHGVYGNDSSADYVRLERILSGKTKYAPIKDLLLLVKFTGVPFDELFREEETEEAGE